MTREAAIKILKFQAGYFCDFKACQEQQAFTMAIKALEQEPCDDAISRKAVLDIVNNPLNIRLDEIIKKLQPVNPQETVTEFADRCKECGAKYGRLLKQKTGRWIAQDIHNCHTAFKCSKCGYIYSFTHLYGKPKADYSYCPNCGAKMEGGQNGK